MSDSAGEGVGLDGRETVSERRAAAAVPPSLPFAQRRWNPLVFAPVGVWARLLYLMVGVLISWGWALGMVNLILGDKWYGGAPQITWVWWAYWVLSVWLVPLAETLFGYAMIAVLSALRVRESLQLWLWAGFWAFLHYGYQGNSLVVFGPFVVMGVCMIAYNRRSIWEAMAMTAALHVTYNASVEPLKALVRWTLA